jgi:transposase-like protein
MSNRPRKHFTSPAEKISILRKHLLEAVPISNLCDENQLQPTVFYRWQKHLFENGAVIFTTKGDNSQTDSNHRIALLEQKLARKNEVISELMEKYVRLKKQLS